MRRQNGHIGAGLRKCVQAADCVVHGMPIIDNKTSDSSGRSLLTHGAAVPRAIGSQQHRASFRLHQRANLATSMPWQAHQAEHAIAKYIVSWPKRR